MQHSTLPDVGSSLLATTHFIRRVFRVFLVQQRQPLLGNGLMLVELRMCGLIKNQDRTSRMAYAAECGYVDQQGCGSARMWISKDVDQQGCGSARMWISKDVDQQGCGLIKDQDRTSRMAYAAETYARATCCRKENFGYSLGIQPVGAVVRLKLCQLFKKHGVQDDCGSVDMWICESAKMWISKTLWIFVTRRLTSGAEYEYEYE
ncbi:hypothetical protein O0I10_008788 [Lichtheimia ornata]|uniref:Uncharacterized protein n=1 Tax=Lichtheimia ornata TaxID=688661 RepID=A0AAD7UZJ3_9FUNG|nr:uncharacterized protein O0I10_008788 [Lichtheimia ornata]KAJ8655502.1 hypothetical protein O0I10_008788 [Lichtheimia ornata]